MRYCDEAHTLLGQEWVGAKGAPNGFNQAQLQADLKATVWGVARAESIMVRQNQGRRPARLP